MKHLSIYAFVLMTLSFSCQKKADENYTDLNKKMIEHYHKKWNVFQKRLERMPAGIVKGDEQLLHATLMNILDSSSSSPEVMEKLEHGGALLSPWVNTGQDGLNALVLTMITRIDSMEYRFYALGWHFKEIHPVVYTVHKNDSTEVRVYLGAEENIVPYVRLNAISGQVYTAPKSSRDDSGRIYNSITVSNKDLKQLKGLMIYPDHKGKDHEIPFEVK